MFVSCINSHFNCRTAAHARARPRASRPTCLFHISTHQLPLQMLYCSPCTRTASRLLILHVCFSTNSHRRCHTATHACARPWASRTTCFIYQLTNSPLQMSYCSPCTFHISTRQLPLQMYTATHACARPQTP